MMCLRQFLLFLILLPFPTAPPILMILITVLMWIKLRPCIYCSVLLVIVFTSSCNTGFMSLSFPDHTTPLWIQETQQNATLPGNGTQLVLAKNETDLVYASPVPNRCWCDLNQGRLLWPVLNGYRYLDWKLHPKVKEDLKKWRIQRNTSGFPTRTEEAKPEPLLEIPVETPIADKIPEWPTSTSWWQRLSFKRATQLTAVTPSRTEAYDPQVPEDPYHEDPLMNWDGTTTDAELEMETLAPTSSSQIGAFVSPAAASWWSSWTRPRYDLRMHGIGMVVDFGLTRSEEDVKEEVMEMLDWREKQLAQRQEKAVEDEVEGFNEKSEGTSAATEPSTDTVTMVTESSTNSLDDKVADSAQSQPSRTAHWLSRFLGRRETAEEL
ncbi:hypothetical protein NliqN6_3266 [Naganishia liquefaciens]|uniref:Uncharacterized protein n=1 Tax=Naganishia liquefaciens TaxID=104408 RepID=A0A8H3TTQ1_9TREE|nr:hypothetical protein NliqN6_3266 [Naganishia liquefaciens]